MAEERRDEGREWWCGGESEKEGKNSENKLLPIQYSWIKELASFHTYLFSLCVNAAAAQATSTGNRQLKLTRRSWLPAERYCQVEQASTAPAQTSWQTGLISLAMIATLPTYPVLYNSFCGSSYFLQLSRQRLDNTLR